MKIEDSSVPSSDLIKDTKLAPPNASGFSTFPCQFFNSLTDCVLSAFFMLISSKNLIPREFSLKKAYYSLLFCKKTFC